MVMANLVDFPSMLEVSWRLAAEVTRAERCHFGWPVCKYLPLAFDGIAVKKGWIYFDQTISAYRPMADFTGFFGC